MDIRGFLAFSLKYDTFGQKYFSTLKKKSFHTIDVALARYFWIYSTRSSQNYCHFLVVGIGTLPWVEFWRYPFPWFLVIFLYKKTPKIRKKGIFKIRPTVGFRCPQLKIDNSFVKYMLNNFKNTEQGLHQLCVSVFSLV